MLKNLIQQQFANDADRLNKITRHLQVLWNHTHNMIGKLKKESKCHLNLYFVLKSESIFQATMKMPESLMIQLFIY